VSNVSILYTFEYLKMQDSIYLEAELECEVLAEMLYIYLQFGCKTFTPHFLYLGALAVHLFSDLHDDVCKCNVM